MAAISMTPPGTCLKARLDKLSIYTAGGCGCKSVAKEMNKLGLDRCRRKRDSLAVKLKQAANKAGYARDSLDHFGEIIDQALADCDASMGPKVPINSLAVITSFFNPAHYQTNLANFQRFAANLRGQKVSLHAIELAFDNDPFETDAEFKVRGSSEHHRLWQKERLLNTVIQAVGPKYDALAWVDADIIFTRHDWAEEACKVLSRYPVCQLFRGALDLRPDNTMTKHRPSTASLWPAKRAYNLNQSHPGFAWAGRTDWLLKHGLEERTVTGGGDCMMVKAFMRNGNVKTSSGVDFDKSFGAKWKRGIAQWVEPVAAEIGGRMGFVDQSVIHLWHGDVRNRRYLQRWNYLIHNDYDPLEDVRIDETGLLAWTEQAQREKPGMVRNIRDYFALRKEDG